MSIDTVADAIITSLGEKAANPTSKEEAIGVLTRSFQATATSANPPPIASRRALFKTILSPLIGSLEDRADTVRDAACSALASARRFLADEAAYARLTSSVDEPKKSRIDQTYQKMCVVVKPVVKPPKTPSASQAQALGDLPVSSEPVTKRPPASTPLAGRSQTKKSRVGPKATPKAKGPLPTNTNFASEMHMSNDEVRSALINWSVPEVTINNLTSSNWKERLESIDHIYSVLSSTNCPPFDSPAFSQSLIRFLLQAPGFKETNIQIKCRLLETLASIMENSKRGALCESLFADLTSGLVALICTPKLVASCEACFNGLERCCGLATLGDVLLNVVSTAKMPKSVEYSVLWLSRALERAANFW